MEQIIKSQNDRRLFKHITLPNNLQVLLVSDVLTENSSASLSISIGSHNDDIQGIAHFLEHMLFMGSEKYPDENEYTTILKENNGSSNAYTANDHTNYYFSCVNESFLKVLDVFAQFFISPLFKTDSVNREINAVDSEYCNSLTNDSWIFDAAKKQFMSQTHESCKFNMGCMETLNIPNIRDIVMNFYNKYYSSELMKLVVVSNDSLDILEQNIINMFSIIPQKNVLCLNITGNLYKKQTYGKVVPMKDEHKLDMLWEFENDNTYHIEDFMSHILGHEGSGSLFEILYKNFFVKTLSAGVDDKIKTHIVFGLNIHLTDHGFNHIDTVKRMVIDYLDMFSKSSYFDISNLYNECKTIKEIKFKNYSIPDAESFVTSLSAFWATENINTSHLIAFSYMYENYNINIHNTLINILSGLTYENSIIFVRSKTFDGSEFNEDKWYKSKYLHCDWITQLNDVNLQFSLPKLNTYICNNPLILGGINNDNHPQLLQTNNIDLWWKYDTVHNTPDIIFTFNIVLPNKNVSIENNVLFTLYLKCFDHIVNTELYNINCANYSVSISRTPNGLNIYIKGYPEKFLNVLDFIVNALLNIKNNMNENIFNNIKNIYKKELENYIYVPPYKMINTELSVNITKNVYSTIDKLDILHTITYNNLMNYDLFNTETILKINSKKRISVSHNRLYGIIQGNISQDLASIIVSKYLSKIIKDENITCDYNEQIKECVQNEFLKIHDNINESNSCYMLAIKFGYLISDMDIKYIEKLSYLTILNEIISEQYFDVLRTKEQLGYVAYSHNYCYGNDSEQLYSTYNFCVQSPNKTAEFLKNRTLNFVDEFREFLVNETEESINNVIMSQISQLEKPFQNLSGSTMYNFSIISNGMDFDMKNKKIECLRNINKKTLTEFYNKYFTLNNDTYWSMLIEGNKSKENI